MSEQLKHVLWALGLLGDLLAWWKNRRDQQKAKPNVRLVGFRQLPAEPLE